MLLSKKINKVAFVLLAFVIYCGVNISTINANVAVKTEQAYVANIIDIVLIDRSSVTMNINTEGAVAIQLINIENEVVYEVNVVDENTHTINTTGFPAGDYTVYAELGTTTYSEVITLE